MTHLGGDVDDRAGDPRLRQGGLQGRQVPAGQVLVRHDGDLPRPAGADPFLVGDVTVSYTDPLTGEAVEQRAAVRAETEPGEMPPGGLFADPYIEKAFVTLNVLVGFKSMTLAAETNMTMVMAARTNLNMVMAADTDIDLVLAAKTSIGVFVGMKTDISIAAAMLMEISITAMIMEISITGLKMELGVANKIEFELTDGEITISDTDTNLNDNILSLLQSK